MVMRTTSDVMVRCMRDPSLPEPNSVRRPKDIGEAGWSLEAWEASSLQPPPGVSSSPHVLTWEIVKTQDGRSGGTMRKAVTAVAVAAAFVSLTSVRAQDSKTTLDAAARALGDVSSIQFSGTGTTTSNGQSFKPDGP